MDEDFEYIELKKHRDLDVEPRRVSIHQGLFCLHSRQQCSHEPRRPEQRCWLSESRGVYLALWQPADIAGEYQPDSLDQ